MEIQRKDDTSGGKPLTHIQIQIGRKHHNSGSWSVTATTSSHRTSSEIRVVLARGTLLNDNPATHWHVTTEVRLWYLEQDCSTE
jgi:hypothetical protein